MHSLRWGSPPHGCGCFARQEFAPGHVGRAEFEHHDGKGGQHPHKSAIACSQHIEKLDQLNGLAHCFTQEQLPPSEKPVRGLLVEEDMAHLEVAFKGSVTV